MVVTDGERLVAFMHAVSGRFFVVEKFGFKAEFSDLTLKATDD